jgi:hypothetical protein
MVGVEGVRVKIETSACIACVSSETLFFAVQYNLQTHLYSAALVAPGGSSNGDGVGKYAVKKECSASSKRGSGASVLDISVRMCIMCT